MEGGAAEFFGCQRCQESSDGLNERPEKHGGNSRRNSFLAGCKYSPLPFSADCKYNPHPFSGAASRRRPPSFWRAMVTGRTAHALELYAKHVAQQTRFTLSSSLRRIHSECHQRRVYRFHPLLALPLNYDMSLDGFSRNRAFPLFHQAANVGHEAKWH